MPGKVLADFDRSSTIDQPADERMPQAVEIRHVARVVGVAQEIRAWVSAAQKPGIASILQVPAYQLDRFMRHLEDVNTPGLVCQPVTQQIGEVVAYRLDVLPPPLEILRQ